MKINISGIDKTFDLLDSIVTDYPEEVVIEVTEDIYKNAKKNIAKHSKSGRLENNLDMRVRRSEYMGEVYINNQGMLVQYKGKPVNYALFLHFGTAPYTIEPKNKKSLRWSGVNGFVFAKKVHHPGIKADPFMTNAAQKTFKSLDKIFTRIYDGL